MSDIRKWLTIIESVPSTLVNQRPKSLDIKKDATVMLSLKAGGGTARYMHSTPTGAMVDIKGVSREVTHDDFSIPSRDYEDPYENGNTWNHSTNTENTIGSLNDKPEFRSGDMVKIDDIYGNVIGPGFGIFIAYSTSGQECIISFDNKQIVVPTSNVGAVLEQNAKDNFSQTDNDGNLSPMSLGSQNVKIEKEPVMDQRDEFSKWISTVESALSDENKTLAEDVPLVNECGCGNWECSSCFPSQDDAPTDNIVNGGEEIDAFGDNAASEIEFNTNEIEVDGMFNEGDPVQDFRDAGGKITQLPYKSARKERNSAGKTLGSSHIGTLGGSGSVGSVSGKGANLSSNSRQAPPVIGSGRRSVDEEDMDFDQIEKPRSGKGVKLGSIVSKTEFRKTGGSKSPMTYGDDNLDETPFDGDYSDEAMTDYMRSPAGRDGLDEPTDDTEDYTDWTMRQGEMGNPARGIGETPDDPDFDAGEDMEMGSPLNRRDLAGEMSQIDPEEAMEKIGQIRYMQDMGLSNSQTAYDEDQLANMTADQLKQVHQQVTGNMSEETSPKPTQTKTKKYNPLDDLDDVLNPRQDDLPATIGGSDDDEIAHNGADTPMNLPVASRDTTQSRLRNLDPMRDYMDRANPDLAAMAAAEPQMAPTTDVVVRTARDVPAVISNALRASGIQSPEWHLIRNLPGMNDNAVRALGRGMMSTMTSTPVEDIKVVADLRGRGPNSRAEVNSVANWLRDNAEDLGEVTVSHGGAAPGYAPQAHNFRKNGILFHVVKDHGGNYIYTWPDADSRKPGAIGNDDNSEQTRIGNGRNMPRLGESIRDVDMKLSLKPTLFEQLKWDEEINAILRESVIEEEELDESSLSKLIGKQKGGQKLVHWLHRKHKLGNMADLQPQPFNERMLWKEFKRNPDNFVVVSASAGVAGIKPYEKMIRDRMEAARKKGKEYDPGGDSTLQYQIIAFTDDGQQVDPALLQPARQPDDEREADPTVMKARMGKISGKDTQNPDNVFNLLADQIGSLRTVYLAGGAVERDKMKTRADMKKEPEVDEMTAVKRIFKRVRPVLRTLGMQALSQINNRAKRYIEGGNFEAATKISQSGVKLKQFLATIDTTGEVNLDRTYGSNTRSFTDQIVAAIVSASGSRPGTPEYKEFLKRAADGGSIELKPVLDALRDNLVSLA